MSRNVGILMMLLVGCGQGVPPATQLSALDAGPRMSGCAEDADCPAGMLCESCGDGFSTCVPGCRTDAECGPNMLCSHEVQCLTCPCPSGYCDLDPCRDLDGDGYAAALTGSCPGKLVGDCDDSIASVHPGGTERCANGRDDDCDGATDSRDTECRDMCSPGFGFCGASIQCGTQRWCDRGCCEACAPAVDPVCAPGECLLSGGLDQKGCFAASVCGVCSACSTNYEPVCGRNFATYSNACLAQAAGVAVMHDGECSRGEGIPCEGQGDCYSGSQFCRDFGGGDRRCARKGTCTVDADCAYVTSVVSCGDAGAASYECRSERCAAVCP